MKKKLEILITAMLMLFTCIAMPFSATADANPLVTDEFMQDFEDVALGTYSATEFQTATGIPMAFYDGRNDPITHKDNIQIEVLEEADGNKIAKFSTGINMSQLVSAYSFSRPVYAGTIELAVKTKATSSSTSWDYFQIISSEGKYFTTVNWSTYWRLTESNGQILNANIVNAMTQRHHLRSVISRNSIEEDWKMIIYNESDPEDPYEYYSATLPAAEYPSIAAAELLRCYTVDSTESVFDDYSVKVTHLPEVIEDSQCDGAEPNSESLKIGFNGPVTFGENDVKIVKVSDESVVINTRLSYNPENYELTMFPRSFLEYNTEYKVVFESGGVKTYTFTTADKPVHIVSSKINYMQNNSTLTDLPSSGTFNAIGIMKLSNMSSDVKNVSVMLVSYNKKGKISEIQITNATIPARRENFNVTVRMTGLRAADTSEVAIFSLENMGQAGYRIMP